MYEILFKSTSKRIIENLMPGRRSLTELSRAMDLSKPALQQKHLPALEDIGIVEKSIVKNEKGREAYYSLRRFSLFFAFDPGNRCGISITTSSRFAFPLLLMEQLRDDEFKADLKLLTEKITQISKRDLPEFLILFGSVARGEGTWKSDIDIAILRLKWEEKTRRKYLNLLSDVTMSTTHQIKPQFLTLLEFEGSENLLAKEIKKSGIVIYGDIFGRSQLWREMKIYKNISL